MNLQNSVGKHWFTMSWILAGVGRLLQDTESYFQVKLTWLYRLDT